MITELKMMCRDHSGWGCDQLGNKINEIIRALNTMEAAATNRQQLKAEILPLIKQALGEIEGGKFFDAVNPLEQAAAKLSAV